MHAFETFERGKRLLAQGDGLAALRAFEEAHSFEPDEPLYESFLALALIRERGQQRRAIELAAEALEHAEDVPECYVNAAEVYLAASEKAAAVAVAQEAVKRFPLDARVELLRRSLGIRRPPIFASLDRSHWLNKYTGLVLTRLGLR